MKVAVYAIAKNESANVARWLNSVREADGIFVLDTGSTDNTVELLEAAGVQVARWSPDFEFRFDTARNASLDLVPYDYDLCISLDFDEIIADGWRRQLDSFEGNAANYTLIFSYDTAGNVTCSYPRFAIHKRRGFYWKYPAHEVLSANNPCEIVDLPIAVIHLPASQKPAGHYLDLLRKGYEENPNDPRCVQYLARELMYCRQYGPSISLFERHIKLEPHAQFRLETYRYIAYMQFELNNLGDCETAYFKAIAEFPEAREAYCDLAHLYHICGQHEAAIGMLRTALRITEKPDVPMVFKDEYYGYWPYHLLAACYFQLGQQNEAIKNMCIAVQHCPNGMPNTLIDDLTRCGLNVHFSSQSADAKETQQEGVSKPVLPRTDEVSSSVSGVESPSFAESTGK